MKFLVMYGSPFAMDIIVSLVLFVGRHSLASQGYDEGTVGSVVLFYGIGYVVASLMMSRIVKPKIAKQQLLGALAGVMVLSVILANVKSLLAMQIFYSILPLATSLFFNAFQIYMLGVTNDDNRPLGMAVGHYTLSWSLGFALGPFISSLLKQTLPWAAIYYTAGFLALMLAVVLYVFKAERPEREAEADAARSALANAKPSLIMPAWIGTVAGFTVWNAVLIYWAVQAVEVQASEMLKGSVELVFALAQGLSALALAYIKGWQEKAWSYAVLGAFGVAALGIFSIASGWLFALAAALYGIFTGGMFCFMVYHSMIDESKAVRRVSLNEVFVGSCFLIASPVAGLLHPADSTYASSYLWLMLIFGLAITVQTALSFMIYRRAENV